MQWLTDIHLSSLTTQKIYAFTRKLVDNDAILISGDIACSNTIVKKLDSLARFKPKSQFYFVLGNHDFYYSSIEKVRSEVSKLCKKYYNLIYLTEQEVLDLNENTSLVGVDGFADAGFGNIETAHVKLNDEKYISNFMNKSRKELKEVMYKFASKDADALFSKIMRAAEQKVLKKNVVIVTHVPPFREFCLYKSKPADVEYLPYFCSRTLGFSILSAHNKCKQMGLDVKFKVLCGHTHHRAAGQVVKDVEVCVGQAVYCEPEIQDGGWTCGL